jgi:uncharacterized protein
MPTDGSLDYIELPGPDIPASKQFYGAVFGWSFTDYSPDYAAFQSPDGREGGFNAERKVAEGGPLVVLYANDPGGRRFHFRDPNGNEIAVWMKM